jgi:uncharacterized membrane protein
VNRDGNILAGSYRCNHGLGPVFLCYAIGFLLSFVIPEKSIAMSISEILVPVAIPLILFTADLSSIKRLAWPALLSYILLAAAVVLVSSTGFFIFRNSIEIADKLSGMAVGVYVGGTMNLMAIGYALKTSYTDIVLANTSDMVVGGIYFFLLLTLMPKLVNRFLPKPGYRQNADDGLQSQIEHEFNPDKLPFTFIAAVKRIPMILLAVVSLGLAIGLSLLVTGEMNVMVIMLIVTCCGIGLSFIKRVRNAPGSFAMGQYLIYMFSIGIGLSFDISNINARSLLLLLFFAFAQFGSIFLHLLLAKIFRIDGHIALITSTAGIFSVPFIIPVANAMKDREIILPGLICGIIGLAIGNFLGIGTALLLGLF